MTDEEGSLPVANECSGLPGTENSLDGDENKRRKRKRKRKKLSASEDDQNDGLEEQFAVKTEDRAETEEQEVQRTIFVEGIPYDCTREDLCRFFQQHLQSSPDAIVDCRLPTWPDTGRLKGYGHVVFATRDLQQSACELNNKKLYLKERYLTIAPAKPPRSGPAPCHTNPGEPSKTIVLHNLSFDATEEDISKVFKSSKIAQGGIRVVRHNATKRSRGFAYVEFESVESAQEALEEPIIVLGRQCRVDFDHGTVQKSFRTETGRLWHKSYGGNKSSRVGG